MDDLMAVCLRAASSRVPDSLPLSFVRDDAICLYDSLTEHLQTVRPTLHRNYSDDDDGKSIAKRDQFTKATP